MSKQYNTGENLQKAVRFPSKSEGAGQRTKVCVFMIFLITLGKLVAMGLFSSDYQNKMFEPFISEFIMGCKQGMINPYQLFYDTHTEMNFPYPPLMLFIMSIGEGICLLFPKLPIFLHNIIFKLPLLGIDYLVLNLLFRKYQGKEKSIILFYFSSPIVFYATYMHGQLDMIPMAFLFLAMYFVTGLNSYKRIWISAVFFAMALLSKLHIIACFPIILIYIYKHHGIKWVIRYGCGVVLMTMLGIWPFWGSGFAVGVLFNTAQSALFSLFLSYGTLNLYLVVLAVVVIYLYVLNINFINSELLFSLAGLIFSVFLALCAPMPGWYMWVVFFLADFLIRANGYKHSTFCYYLLQTLYLVFFLFFHKAENGAVDLYFLHTECSFLKYNNVILCNVSFSLLSAVLIYMIFLMHKYCIAGNGLYYFHDKAFVIGICGDSGTGKSSLLASIGEMFNHDNLLSIEGDGDHKWERENQNWKNFTHLNPQANYLYRQAMDIKMLKNGESVKRVEYNHSTGHFTAPKTLKPSRFIAVSGLHILYLPQFREIVDLKIYLEVEEELRIKWKMERDEGERGRSKDEILQQIRLRYEDAQKYIYPQKEFADIIIRYFSEKEESLKVGMEFKITTKIDMDYAVSALRAAGAKLSYEYSDDFRYQIIVFNESENPEMTSETFDRLFQDIFLFGYDILSKPFKTRDVADGIRKLVLIQAIHDKLRGKI